MKTILTALALMPAGASTSALAIDDIYCLEGYGAQPHYGLPLFVPPDATVLSFDWQMSFTGQGPSGTSAGISEWLNLGYVTNPGGVQVYNSLWNSPTFIAPPGDPLPPNQFGHASLDLSAFQGTTIAIAFNIKYNSAFDLRDDSSAEIENIQFMSVPEPTSGSLLLLILGGGLGLKAFRRRVVK